MNYDDWSRVGDLARRAADREVPPPPFEPAMAGVLSGGITLIVVAFGIPDLDVSWVADWVPMIGAFLPPYVLFNIQRERNSDARVRHRVRLRADRILALPNTTLRVLQRAAPVP